MKKTLLQFTLLLSILFIVSCTQPIKQVKETGIDYSLMDTLVRPQDDFYNYVNGTWMKNASIPDDKTRWGSFLELRESTQKDVLEILQEASSANEKDLASDAAKAVKLFNLITDTITRNKLGVKPLLPRLEEVSNLKSTADFQQFFKQNVPKQSNILFGIYVSANAKNSNSNSIHLYPGRIGIERDYYLKEDEDSKKILEAYRKHVARMFVYFGKSNEESAILADQVINIETKMAASRLDKVQRRNPDNRYNPKTVTELDKMVSFINWGNLFGSFDTDYSNEIIVSDLGYYENLSNLVNDSPFDELKAYMKWNLINQAASKLSMDLERANWDFYSKTLRGAKKQEPLEKRALRVVNRSIGEALGQLYVAKKFPPEAKEKMNTLVQNLIKAYTIRINELPWMNEETKKKAIEKLNSVTVKVGYPDKWKEYSKLNLANAEGEENYYIATQQINSFDFANEMEDLKNPVDKSVWYMSPQTVNAYYNPSFNEIVFPAAILQPPFFNFNADAPVNYGGIGAVIGHEISHGFDDSGAKYDSEGNLTNWWRSEDSLEFATLGDDFANQYSKLEVLPEVFINGKFTLGENIGDLGGVNAAYDALQIYYESHPKPEEIDGFTPEQRFFMSWATVWRNKIREEALKDQIRRDPHSPGYNRATQPLKNIDVFYQAFNVQEGDSMYLPVEERIVIW